MKKSKNGSGNEKKASLIATGFALSALIPCASYALDWQYSLGASFNFGKPISFDSKSYTPSIGGSLRFSVQPNTLYDFFIQGDFLNTAIIDGKPSASNPNQSENLIDNVFSAEVGMTFYVPLNDRFKMNFDLGVGVGSLSNNINNSIGTFNAFVNVGFTYRLRPSVSIKAAGNVSGALTTGGHNIIPAGASTGITVNLNEAFSNSTKVSVETKEVLPVFPVLYSWYENNPFGTVSITNEEDTSITDINVSFYQQQYMAQPNLCVHKDSLTPGESFDAELTAFFNERMLDLTELAETKSQVLVEYSYLGQRKVKTYQMNIPVYGRNSMSWADDRRAAVFVSSKDPAAMWFAKYVTSIVRDNIRDGITPNIQYAMGIFETLDQFGINYVIDPTSAYEDNIGGESIDFLQFPYQTLMYRGGDCDDLSILVSSLFEAIGIKTAFITIPGHIFMAFDTGLDPLQAEEQFSDMSQVIVRGDRVWMPLEITISDEGFNKAWHVGAREWNMAEAQDAAALYPMEESWILYKPVNVPGATARFTMPDTTIVSKLFQHSLDEWVSKEIQPLVENYKRQIAKEDTPETRNALGVLYGRYGLFTNAEEQFRKSRTEGYLPSVLNTANILFATKNYKKALQWYKLVLESEPRNEKALLGVARCEYELENYSACDKYYSAVCKMNPEMAKEYAYLGSFFSTAGRSYTLADRLSTILWDNPKLIKEEVIVEESEEEDEEPIDITAPLDFTLPKTKEEIIEEEQYRTPELSESESEEVEDVEAVEDVLFFDETLPFVDITKNGLSGEVQMLIPDAEIVLAEDSVILPVDEKKNIEEEPPVQESSLPVKELPVEKVIADEPEKNPAADSPNEKNENVPVEQKPVVETEVVPVEQKTTVVTEVVPVEQKPVVVTETVSVEKEPSVVKETAPAAQKPVVVTEVVPEEQKPVVETEVVPEEQKPVVETEVVPEEQKPVVETEVVPVEKKPVVETGKVPEEQKSVVITEVVPVEQKPFVETEVVPVEKKPVVVTETVPVEQKPAVVTEGVREEQKTTVVTEVVPVEQKPVVVTEAVPEEQNPVVVTETVPEEQKPAVVTEVVPEEQKPVVVTEVVPAEQKPVVVTEKVQEEQKPAVVTEVVPEEQKPAVVTEVVPQEQKPAVVAETETGSVIPAEEYAVEMTELLVPDSVFETYEDNNDVTETASVEQNQIAVTEPVAEEQKTVVVTEKSYEEDLNTDEFAYYSEEPLSDITEPQITDYSYAAEDTVTTEEIDFTQVLREVPRFTKQPSSEWAPDSAYEITEIPGMRSFEEEMGEYQNEKAFLYKDEELALGVDEEDAVAQEEEVKEDEVNPFGSYIETIDDEEFMQVMSEKVSEEKFEEIKARREAESIARQQKIEEQKLIEEQKQAQSKQSAEEIIPAEVQQNDNEQTVAEVQQIDVTEKVAVEEITKDSEVTDNSITVVNVANVTTEAVQFESRTETSAAEETYSENKEAEQETIPVHEKQSDISENRQTVTENPINSGISITAEKQKPRNYTAGIIVSAIAALCGSIFGLSKSRKKKHGKDSEESK